MIVKPVSPRSMRTVAGLATPKDFYCVLESPAPLAGMAFPDSSPWQALASAGFRKVVCLTHAIAPYDPKPLEVLFAARFKDLDGGKDPDEPAREQAALREIVAAVKSEVLLGNGVVVHCQGGTGRTGAVIACTLRALGVAFSEVRNYMQELKTARIKGPGWLESEWQRKQVEEWSAG